MSALQKLPVLAESSLLAGSREELYKDMCRKGKAKNVSIDTQLVFTCTLLLQHVLSTFECM